MLRILDRGTRLCDGIRRREMLSIGGLGALGLTLPQLLAARETPPDAVLDAPTFGRAKNVIYLWMQGGPPQHETFDPKPDAPVEIRGPFQPIQTNVVGTQFCELLPRTARIADKLAVVRSLSTGNNIHSASGYHVLTGNKYIGPNARTITPNDWPWFGSLVKMLKPSEALPPLSTVWIPDIMRLNENVTPAGQTAGFMGRQWDPDAFIGDPSDPNYEVEGLRLSDIPPIRFDRRRSLLDQLDRHFLEFERGRAPQTYGKLQAQAYDLLTTDRVRNAFAIQQEAESLKDRYGRTGWGQTVLLARRLVEAGVRLVHVNWVREPGDSAVDNPMWDTHAQNADRMEDRLCPIFDVTFPALIEDLDQRGLLEETLVIAIAEFGRTPKINANGGRDHWGPVFSFAMAGAGVVGGSVYGASDKEGGYPARDVVHPEDVTATLFHLLGIDHRRSFLDPQRRERQLTTGQPLWSILSAEPPPAKTTKPEGSLARVPPYNNALLLNTDFETDAPLYSTDLGSRPKGWRATPQPDRERGNDFGVRLVEDDSAPSFNGKRHLQLGFGMAGGSAEVKIEAGTQAIVAQEMRSPRAGTYRFTIRAAGGGTSAEFFAETFLKHFKFRLTIYRYTEETKNPANREEFHSVEFRPAWSAGDKPDWQEFQLTKQLDSPSPGANFSTGLGLGVAIIVERKTPETLAVDRGSAWLRIDNAEVKFDSRSINDKVIV